MLRAIDSAQESIRLEVYIYRVSPIGEQIRGRAHRVLNGTSRSK